MKYSQFFEELASCGPGSKYHPLNVIDIRTKPRALYTVPQMVTENSINHLTDQQIGKSRKEPYSSSTSYYALVTQDSGHTTWHQDYSSTSVFYTVLMGEKIFKPTKKNLSIFRRWSDSENDQK